VLCGKLDRVEHTNNLVKVGAGSHGISHPLAAKPAIDVHEIAGETFISVSGTALSISGKQPALRRTIDRYLKDNGIEVKPGHEVDNLGGVVSLIASTRGIALLPLYAKTFLPDTVTTRPLRGPGPKIDLSIAYRIAKPSPILKLFLSRVNKLATKFSQE
jgi:LysR family hca operon transcriptional activator